MPTLVLYVEVPIAVLNEDRDVIVAQIPPYVVVVFLVFRRLDRQRKIPAAQSGTFITLSLLSHYYKFPYVRNWIFCRIAP